jgi:hypothetical protein
MKIINSENSLTTEELVQFKMDIHLWKNCLVFLIIFFAERPPPTLPFEKCFFSHILSDEGGVCEKTGVGRYVQSGF